MNSHKAINRNRKPTSFCEFTKTSKKEKPKIDVKKELAEEVRKQKLEEAQAISEAVLDAEVKIGELMAQVPKATKDNARKQIDSSVDLIKPKADVIRDAGFTQKQVERFQTLAAHPDIVEQAKAETRENDKKSQEYKENHLCDFTQTDISEQPKTTAA